MPDLFTIHKRCLNLCGCRGPTTLSRIGQQDLVCLGRKFTPSWLLLINARRDKSVSWCPTGISVMPWRVHTDITWKGPCSSLNSKAFVLPMPEQMPIGFLLINFLVSVSFAHFMERNSALYIIPQQRKSSETLAPVPTSGVGSRIWLVHNLYSAMSKVLYQAQLLNRKNLLGRDRLSRIQSVNINLLLLLDFHRYQRKGCSKSLFFKLPFCGFLRQLNCF